MITVENGTLFKRLFGQRWLLFQNARQLTVLSVSDVTNFFFLPDNLKLQPVQSIARKRREQRSRLRTGNLEG